MIRLALAFLLLAAPSYADDPCAGSKDVKQCRVFAEDLAAVKREAKTSPATYALRNCLGEAGLPNSPRHLFITITKDWVKVINRSFDVHGHNNWSLEYSVDRRGRRSWVRATGERSHHRDVANADYPKAVLETIRQCVRKGKRTRAAR